jgi:ABC-type xylose transport system permease subunit
MEGVYFKFQEGTVSVSVSFSRVRFHVSCFLDYTSSIIVALTGLLLFLGVHSIILHTTLAPSLSSLILFCSLNSFVPRSLLVWGITGLVPPKSQSLVSSFLLFSNSNRSSLYMK